MVSSTQERRPSCEIFTTFTSGNLPSRRSWKPSKRKALSSPPVFDSSFYVETNLSFGSLKHILKKSPFLTQCNLLKVKNGSEFSVVLE